MTTYLVVKCHGRAIHLIPGDILEALTSAKSPQDIAAILTPTDYGRLISGLERLDAQTLEGIFHQVLAERFKAVVKLASGGLEKFLKAYTRRLEVRNLSRLLRGKYSALPPGEVKAWLIPLEGLSSLDYEALIEAGSLEEVLELLKGSPYEKLKDYMDTCRSCGSILPLEYAIKNIYYQEVLTYAGKLPHGSRAVIRHLIGLEVDLANVSTSLAPLVYGYSEDLIRQLLIPFHYRVSAQKLMEVVEAKTPQAALNALASYSRIVEFILEKRDDLAEAEGLRLLRRTAEKTMQSSPIEPPYIMGYLTLCELECRDLTFISIALEHGLDPKGYLSI